MNFLSLQSFSCSFKRASKRPLYLYHLILYGDDDIWNAPGNFALELWFSCRFHLIGKHRAVDIMLEKTASGTRHKLKGAFRISFFKKDYCEFFSQGAELSR